MMFKHQELNKRELNLISELLESQIKKCGYEIKKEYENILFKIYGTSETEQENEPSQAQAQANLNISKICEVYKNE